jgi:hypothetical protein
LESVQYVDFGGLIQRMSSFLFGFLVFSVTVILFVGWTAFKQPQQLKNAFAKPGTLLAVNLTATLAWGAYLTSVQLIEPAVSYTIGEGVMPLTAYLAYRVGLPEGEPLHNRSEALGNLILLAGVGYLVVVTLMGWSGFVRGGTPGGGEMLSSAQISPSHSRSIRCAFRQCWRNPACPDSR